ncbi:MAG: hypothetical protein HPY85_06855 [Anaerolineae bacterium]|nr:hypothetical protein [Anaerolineae bacterium]
MAVEQWIDEIARLCGEIEGHDGKKVKSYSLFEKREIPETLTVFPCAIHYVENVQLSYSVGGPNIELWYGVSEFHLFGDNKRSNVPDALRMYARIRNAFASHLRLNGKVAYCLLRPNQENILGPVEMKYGTENPHMGLVARWVVKEDTTGHFVVS